VLRSAEANERLATGFSGTETGANAVIGMHLNVAGEFSLEIIVVLRCAQQAAKTDP